tara:strand:+ start:10789 stop:15720 length:4932 start_codon:yes stop_codon:yes gene_type:complete
MAASIHTVLAEFREAATSNRDLGDKFERLFANFLKMDPQYQDRFSDVWMWSEWPGRGNQPDTGIDLVAQDRHTHELCAIQCKFYDPAHRLEKSDLDSFFSTSGKHPFTSRIVVSTTDKWSKHAEELLTNQQVQTNRIRVQDLENSAVDWSQFSLKRPDLMKLRPKKTLRPHQSKALNAVMDGLATADRGKLIMACGTGKTFTALKIAEQFGAQSRERRMLTAYPGKTIKELEIADGLVVPGAESRILFLVPSIALLAQSLSEWTAESETPLHCFAVCSDTAVGKARDNEDIRLHDLPFPATTDARKLGLQMASLAGGKPLTVVFSTYQSIATISEAQAKFAAPAFDLVICDEAHRTTGVTLAGNDESHFVKIHDGAYIKAAKRLYMTATPRIFADTARARAEEAEAVVCSMDDPAVYGLELHRLGFGEAVGAGLLADYKVMVLAVDEKFVSKTFQRQLAKDGELNMEDAVRITGCWNGLAKRMAATVGDPTSSIENDPTPMRRAVAFSRSIKDSQRITELFAGVVDQYIAQAVDEERDDLLRCEADHVDGTMNALKRGAKLDWLKADTASQGNVCRILSNARCLSEGVDVPALDAVLFLNPRKSVVDVVQSVGRVMRTSPGKKYGYIILPVGVPSDVSPEVALQDNEKYKVVWQVLQALRAHDDRFNATVNQIELNKARPDNIQVIGVGGGAGDDEGDGGGAGTVKPVQGAFAFPNLDQWRDAIFAKIVIKCGDRRYWESWAADVSKIAGRQVERIKALLESADEKPRKAFDKFLAGLRSNLNPAVSEDDAIEMLAQHLITQPVFDALFEGYDFTAKNPVSRSMDAMLRLLHKEGLTKEQEQLEKFYASVRTRASGIDNAEGKQRIIVELYDKFFRTAFPRMAERLGIVYTPVEVVDFILKSADDALREEFGVGLSDEGVHVLDPFTGTGTFIVRLLQSGLIQPQDLARKYGKELHANEIVLLAYYIAAVNIEAAWHGRMKEADATAGYVPFEGIVLTDTFQLTEGKGAFEELMFPDNNKRAKRQKAVDIRVIVGNPPYSAQQDSENDDNKNLKYPALDDSIRSTYAARSNAGLLKNLYDSYIRAIRWASNRIKERGVVCFVTNGSFIDANNMDGLRLCLAEEFSRAYVFNLRGNQRTSGEQSRMEGGKVFGSGSRATVAITLLVKNPDKPADGQVRYHDIGDYLSREDKLKIVRDFGSIASLPLRSLAPNEHGDWINQRDPAFDAFVPLGDKDDDKVLRLFTTYSLGVVTNRDAWAYNFSAEKLAANMGRMIAFYNEQRAVYEKAVKRATGEPIAVEDVIDADSKKISWTRSLKADVRKLKAHQFEEACIVTGLYRPFAKQRLYFNRRFNEMVYQMPKLFPDPKLGNLVISVTGIGASKTGSAVITDCIPNLHLHDTGQCFPLYYYKEKVVGTVSGKSHTEWVRHDAITDAALSAFRKTYAASRSADGKAGADIGKEDLFYYVYGILHSPEYKKRFESDLKKQLPRIPYARDFWAFSTAGRELAHWHLNYETVEPHPLTQGGELDLGDPALYRVQKMTFARSRVNGKLTDDKTTIIYNARIRLSGIPLEAYDYIVNGKSALEWVIERYQMTTDKKSGIKNDPNDWATEHDDPQYILNLVKRVVRVSVETVRIVKGLPALNEH